MVSAYVLIVVKPGTESKIAEKMVGMKEVKDVSVVYGEYDIIAKIEVENMDKLQEFVINLRKNTDIERTSTMIAVK